MITALVRELAETGGESSPVTAEYAAAYLAAPGSHVLLAEEDGRTVGLLSYGVRPNLYHGGNVALIEELVVTAGARGQGAGSAPAGCGDGAGGAGGVRRGVRVDDGG